MKEKNFGFNCQCDYVMIFLLFKNCDANCDLYIFPGKLWCWGRRICYYSARPDNYEIRNWKNYFGHSISRERIAQYCHCRLVLCFQIYITVGLSCALCICEVWWLTAFTLQCCIVNNLLHYSLSAHHFALCLFHQMQSIKQPRLGALIASDMRFVCSIMFVFFFQWKVFLKVDLPTESCQPNWCQFIMLKCIYYRYLWFSVIRSGMFDLWFCLLKECWRWVVQFGKGG